MTQQTVDSVLDIDDAEDSRASHLTLVKPHAVQSLAQVGNSILERNGMPACDWYRGHQVKGGEELWKFASLGEVAATPAMFKTVLASNYTGPDGAVKLEDALYIGDHIYFDFDAPDMEDAISKVQEFAQKFEMVGVDPDSFKWWASGGKGFHCFIPLELIKENGAASLTLFELQELPIIFRQFAESVFVDSLDLSVYSKRRGRQWRQEKIQRPNGAYKVPLTYSEVRRMDPESYLELVSAPRDIPDEVKVLQVSTQLLKLWTSACDKVKTGQKRIADKRAKAAPLTPAHTDRLESLLEVIGPDDGSYHDWFKGIAAIHEYYAGSEDGYKVAKEWSQRGPKFKDGAGFEATWDALFADYSSNVTIATLIQQTRDNKIKWFDPHPELNPTHDPVVNEEATPLKLTEAALAEYFTAKYADRLVWVSDLEYWAAWDDRKWEEDPDKKQLSALILREGRMLCSRMFHELDSALSSDALDDAAIKRIEKHKLAVQKFFDDKIESERGMASLIKNMQRWARNVTQKDFDSHPFLINTQNGILDLRTGVLSPHDSKYMFSKITYVEYQPAAQCPKFLDFLRGINQVDDEWGEFLLDQLAYGLTGDISLSRSHWWVGGGANGKSTLTELLIETMGTYAHKIPIETFLVARKNRTGNEATPSINALQGVRMLFGTEMTSGAQLDVGQFKSFISTDTMPARRLFGNKIYQVRPVFKFYPFFNELPKIAETTNGVYRRIAKMDFKADFENKDRAKRIYGLEDILIAEEREGVFALLVDRCAKLLKSCARVEGGYNVELPMPKCVQIATDEYRASLDPVAEFMEEHMIFDSDLVDLEKAGPSAVPAAVLYLAYEYFRAANGKPRMSNTAFGAEASKHLEKLRMTSGRVYAGARINLDTFPKDYFRDRIAHKYLIDSNCFIDEATLRDIGGLKQWISLPDGNDTESIA